MTRYYISGPISNDEPAIVARNKLAFHDAQFQLWCLPGFPAVVNPVDLCAALEAQGLAGEALWGACMRKCIAALTECDEIVMLPGNEHSRGAVLELNIAVQLGMPVHTLADLMRNIDGA